MGQHWAKTRDKKTMHDHAKQPEKKFCVGIYRLRCLSAIQSNHMSLKCANAVVICDRTPLRCSSRSKRAGEGIELRIPEFCSSGFLLHELQCANSPSNTKHEPLSMTCCSLSPKKTARILVQKGNETQPGRQRGRTAHKGAHALLS